MHAVAEFIAAALEVLQYSAICFSNNLVFVPVVIHADFNVSTTSSISS